MLLVVFTSRHEVELSHAQCHSLDCCPDALVEFSSPLLSSWEAFCLFDGKQRLRSFVIWAGGFESQKLPIKLPKVVSSTQTQLLFGGESQEEKRRARDGVV